MLFDFTGFFSQAQIPRLCLICGYGYILTIKSVYSIKLKQKVGRENTGQSSMMQASS